jgi:aspartate oxidase
MTFAPAKIREFDHLRLNIEDFYRKARLTDGLIGLRNGVQTALVVARAARHNRASSGCHYRDDARETHTASPPVEGDQLDFPQLLA